MSVAPVRPEGGESPKTGAESPASALAAASGRGSERENSPPANVPAESPLDQTFPNVPLHE